MAGGAGYIGRFESWPGQYMEGEPWPGVNFIMGAPGTDIMDG